MALHFELVTPAKLVRSEDVHMVVVPGTEGGQPENIEVRGGFAEVGENGLTVLAEHVEG